jgi:2-oxoglutarate dehydrogenase E1 component
MPHRGRLTTLANVFSKPMETIFAEFQNKFESNEEVSWGNSGDVKYHLGTTCWREFPNGHTMKLVMLPNPSHLETVDPLVTGKTRAI